MKRPSFLQDVFLTPLSKAVGSKQMDQFLGSLFGSIGLLLVLCYFDYSGSVGFMPVLWCFDCGGVVACLASGDVMVLG